MTEFALWIKTLLMNAGTKILLALLVYFIGKWVISSLLDLVKKLPSLEKQDPTVKAFTLNAVKTILYVVLFVSIISILGVPMASVVTVLASAGVAVGMALQGALSNLAGGIMLMIFRPFSVGDFVSAGGASGVVQEITMFYTILNTLDNVKITIPNGTLMNANVENYSAQPERRVDLVFSCAKGEDIDTVKNAIDSAMASTEKVLSSPEAPFVRLSGGTNESMEFTVRAWCKGSDYWDVYFDLTENITKALGNAGINAPAVRVITESK